MDATRPSPFQCPPIGEGRVPEVHLAIDRWVRSSHLAILVNAFGATIPQAISTEALVSWLVEFSDAWDYRQRQQEATAKDTGESARWLLGSSDVPDALRDQIEVAASALGLIGVSEPERDHYDYVLVLGGARLSCLLRTRFAAELLKRHSPGAQAIALLASERPVADSERVATDTYAPNARTEFDLMVAGAEMCFGDSLKFTEQRLESAPNPNSFSAIRTYDDDRLSVPMLIVSAPSKEPEKRRANSADTLEFFLASQEVHGGASVLLVTSQIYVPYQQIEALRTLAVPRDLIVDAIGYPATWSRDLQGMTGPTNYLQEIRSTLQAAARFLASYPIKTD